MGAAFAFGEVGKRAFLVRTLWSVLVFCRIAAEDGSPTFVENHFSGGSKRHISRLAVDGGGGKTAIGVENGDETPGYQIVDAALHVGERTRRNTGGDNGVVVGHFRRIEHLFRLAQLLSAQRREEIAVQSREPVENPLALAIHVVGQKGGVHARVSGVLGFVKLLYDFECEVGAVTEFAVAFHLQRREVEQARRGFASFFLRDGRDGEGRVLDRAQCRLSFGAVGETAFRSAFVFGAFSFGSLPLFLFLAGVEPRGEGSVAIHRGEHPIGFGHEALDLLLAVHDERQSRRLHPPDAQRLCASPTAIAEFEGIKPGGIHAEQPVADGATQPRLIQSAVFLLRTQLRETLSDGFFRHRRNPQSFHRTLCRSLLHHPALNELTFLPGIPAIDDAFGLSEQLTDHAELFFHALFQANAETLRDHRERRQRPRFPIRRVLLRILEFAEMAECPSHLIAVAFEITGIAPHPMALRGTDDFGNIFGYGGFLGDANNHAFRRGKKEAIIYKESREVRPRFPTPRRRFGADACRSDCRTANAPRGGATRRRLHDKWEANRASKR